MKKVRYGIGFFLCGSGPVPGDTEKFPSVGGEKDRRN